MCYPLTPQTKPFTAGGFTSSGGGQSTSSDSESSSGESLQFDDGLDEELIGDEEDRKKLNQMTEAEREKEMFNRCVIGSHLSSILLLVYPTHLPRFEKRQVLRTRFEIEQRLRRERKAEKKRSKQREKQRRSARDMRGRPQDKTKSRAMDELKAKRSAGYLNFRNIMIYFCL